jgi:hypothetical protein
MKTVTAVIPTTLAESIAAKVASIFPDDFIAQAKDGLTKGVLAKSDVFCFSGSFSDDELALLNTKGFALPGVIYWVQESSAPGEPLVVIASSEVADVNSTKTPKQLIASKGVTFPLSAV